MSQKVKIVVLTVLIIVVTVLDVYATLCQNTALSYKVGVLPMLFTVILYMVAAEKKLLWFLAFQLMSLLGDVVYVYLLDYLTLRTSIYILGYSLLTYGIYVNLHKKSLKKLGVYFAFTFFLYIIIFTNVLNIDLGNNFISISLYGLLLSFLMALALYNYLVKMTEVNLLIFLGVFFIILSDSIYSTVILREDNAIVLSTVFVTYNVAHYLLCMAFILKTNHEVLKEHQLELKE